MIDTYLGGGSEEDAAEAGPCKPAAHASARARRPPPAVDQVDTSYLESLLGYNARRAALAVIEVFLERMAVFDLRPVDFSVLSLITHNPGITSRQLCTTLGILPPNLVGMINALEKRELILRQPHPRDGRAMGLHLTANRPETDARCRAHGRRAGSGGGRPLSAAEAKTLISLLKKIYLEALRCARPRDAAQQR